jgi:Cu-Zn family superoxide dismutase
MRRALLLLAAPLLLAACAPDETPEPAPPDTTAVAPEPEPEPAATATIAPLGESGVTGTVTFTPAEGGLQVTYALDGLAPGRHGFHVHENGDCGPGPDGAPGGAAGDHFAPLGSPHGAPADSTGARHVGDFGNVEAGADGRAAGTFVDPIATLAGETGIVGHAVVVHGGEDDLTSQPSGDAGDRVGCGVILMGAVDMTAPADALPPGHPPIDG